MKIKPPPSSFNLPVLLSFNELAWVAIFGMTLACIYAWRQIDEIPVLQKEASEQCNTIVNLQNTITNLQNLFTNFAVIAKLTNQIGQSERGNERLVVLLAQQRQESAKFSNLWERAVATNAALTGANDKLVVLLAGQRKESAKFSNLWERARATNAVLTRTNDKLVVLLAGQRKESAKFSNLWERAMATNAALTGANDKLAGELAQNNARTSEGEIRQELLSLKGGAAGGSLSNVVILLDRSGSMDAEKGRRWQDAKNVVNTWLSYLPIKNCVLITFNDQCMVFPADDAWLPIDETNRNTLVAQLNGLKPEGFTDTLAALQTAYRYTNADTIILFTDGKPERAPRDGFRSESSGGRGSKEMIKDIHLLCTNRAHIIPINTVGLGDYFNPDLAGFLRQLASETKGTFIGR